MIASGQKRGGKVSNKKMGRPTDNLKSMKIEFRADDEIVKKLDECVGEFGSNRSEVIREGISELHKNLKK